MSNCSINFAHPWLLLLLIPAFLLVFIPYFRLSKKHRRTRNRICSIVLHCIVMVLAVSVLADMTFSYEVPNTSNEIIVLVDMSDSQENSAENRDRAVETVLDYSKNSNLKVGLVTFGLNQKYVAPLTTDINSIYDAYMSSDLPDVSATDIASALVFARSCFTHPESSRIVLISDGKQTDRNASDVARSLAVQGTIVDAIYVSSEFSGSDVQISSVERPDYNVKVNEASAFTVNVFASEPVTGATVQLFDNGELDAESTLEAIEITRGEQTFVMRHTFDSDGLHEIKVKITLDNGDSIEKNSEYITHIYIESFNKILVLESVKGQSEELKKLINTDVDSAFDVTVMDVYNDKLPSTVEELRAYDQVILNNISNADLTDTAQNPNLPTKKDKSVMVDILNEYVYKFGGGMFTVGGDDQKGDQHAYVAEDLEESDLQKMLPVLAVDNYTPPIGVMLIIDRSGSMGGGKLAAARSGALSCYNAVYDETTNTGLANYFGVMTLDNDYRSLLDPIPVTRKDEILNAINKVQVAAGGTSFTGAIKRAINALSALTEVDKRHIVIVTDGFISDAQVEEVCTLVANAHKESNLTLSAVVLTDSGNTSGMSNMQKIVNAGKNEDGTGGGGCYTVSDLSKLTLTMRNDLTSPTLQEMGKDPFKPIVKKLMSPVFSGIETGEEEEKSRMTVKLNGFYGVKKRQNADLYLAGDYDVPVYAQWSYGKGKVGSFMCDLQNTSWSGEFMADKNGIKLIQNIVNNLMPTENIRVTKLSLKITEENVYNRLSVYYSELNEGESITAELVNADTGKKVSLNSVSPYSAEADCFVTAALNAETGYTRSTFAVKNAGVYKIIAKRVNASGVVVEQAESETFKSFAYSAEYDISKNTDQTELRGVMSDIAAKGNGSLVADNDDPVEIFNELVISFARKFDPRYLFIIIAIVLFLADIAVRKFKFKWPHELIREHRERKNGK